MGLIFDSATRTSLDSASTKINWAQLLGTALGNTRRIRCFRDSNASAANPFLTGTEFRNVGSAGAITTVAGKIKKFGQLKGGTISLAADMSTGASILRIEGNGKFIQGTLGLSAAAQIANGVAAGAVVQYDFTVRNSFTAINGFAFTPNFGISGNRFLPSGTGPAAPALDANAPHIFEIWHQGNPAAPVLSGSLTLNTRIDDFVLQDAERSNEIGDVAIYQSTQSIMHGITDVFEFGFTLLASHAGNTKSGLLPLYEVMGAAASKGTWTSYPESDTFYSATACTIPEPFSWKIKNSAGVYIYQSGIINAEYAYPDQWSTTKVVNRNWDCGQQLVWENSPPRMSVKAAKYYSGLTDDAKRPSLAKESFSFNGVEALITGGYQGFSRDGLNHIYAIEAQPRRRKDRPTPNPADPYLSTSFYQNDGKADSSPWASGYEYIEGGFGIHNMETGPGGARHDRSAIASIFALWISSPLGMRLQGNVPWETMALNYVKGYHNHSNHWVKDPKSLLLPKDWKDWRYLGNYYGDATGGPRPKTIDMRGNDLNHATMLSTAYDKYGRLWWGGWVRDRLHAYTYAGEAGLFVNSPRAIIAHKWDAAFALCFKEFTDSESFRSEYMVRSQAWLWKCYGITWKLGSEHPMGISQETIEAMAVTHMENINNNIRIPTFINNEQSLFCNGLRNLGIPGFLGDNYPKTQGAGLGYYMTGVLAFYWKQTGFWSRMYGKGGNVSAVLDMHLANMDKYCFEKILYTRSTQYISGGYQEWAQGSAVPVSWAAWSAQYEGADPAPASLFTNRNGTLRSEYNPPFANGNADNGVDRDVSIHALAAYPYMRRDVLTINPHPLLDQAIAKYDEQYGLIKNNVAAAAGNPQEQRKRDHQFGYPGVSFFKAPLELGLA